MDERRTGREGGWERDGIGLDETFSTEGVGAREREMGGRWRKGREELA